MRVEIFDVEHGQCAMVHCPPNGKKLLIDAGHKTNNWWPSVHFLGQPIELAIITNFDEDHASDIANVREACTIKGIHYNTSINAARLRQMKALSGMGPGIQHIHDWLQSRETLWGGGLVNIDLGHVSARSYCNTYGTAPGQFTDANNLSVATFVTYSNFTIFFPGDLEGAGWRQIMQQPGFMQDLARTTVLVASHHGRDNGCCEELFENWSPRAVIISDAGMQHATQETVNWYANRTSGCQTNTGVNRKVFTTRSDGKITIDVSADRWGILTSPTPITRNALLDFLGAQ